MKKTISRITARAAMVAGMMLCAGTALGQSDGYMTLQTYAGLTIYGSVGSNYTVQCVSDLAQTNSENNWQTLTNIALPSNPYLWVDTSLAATGKRFYRLVSSNNYVTIANPDASKLTWINPGTFVMGSPVSEAERQYWGNDESQHTVVISKGFYMSKYLVTQADYLAVIGSNPSAFTDNPNNPVEKVTWYDATNYCAALTQQQQSAGKIPAGWAYRLPTESEWEYACRAGTTTAFYFGDTIHWTNANFDTHYEYNASVGEIATNTAGLGYYGQTTPVGKYKANPWGLYDMCGNLFEWCQDWYGTCPTGTVTDPTGASSGSNRVLRGGDWDGGGRDCRSALRGSRWPDDWDYDIGFRVVLAPGQP